MAMTLRLTDDETDELRHAAQREGKSMQVFIRDAALEAARRRASRRDDLLDRIVSEDAEALDRLAKA